MISRFTQSLKPYLKSSTSLATTAGKLTPSLTMYHNSNSILSLNLLNQLTSYSLLPCTHDKIYQPKPHNGLSTSKSKPNETNRKFYLNIKESIGLTKEDHKFIIDQCLDIHPDNTRVMIQSVSNVDFKKLSKQERFNLVEQLQDYDYLVSNLNNDSTRSMPLIIDYKHKLLANDDVSFNRIMANYLSCGIQSVARGGNNLAVDVGDGERSISYSNSNTPGVVA
ncbi:hypothetical protein CANMA_004173 [Candida margitis]|uniref:uncharacterized protein n=1 Tax=Candida margitis TaxID=1775924 RepID=UPI0022268BC4|nr:uncharacterized protein CANMA_004173 [Candida margitis]KAI5958756.1 hypothetical protein CANMA_004173 [Candida margitis]